MHVTDHIAALRHDGTRLADAAERAGLDAEVPSCPRWTMRHLVNHVGMVHRWAHQFVAGSVKGGRPPPDDARNPPDGPEALLAWYREGHTRLADALDRAPDDLDSWYFLDAPSARAFWARRQAHETAIHRADAELATGPVTPFPAGFAADGIDEILGGFMSGRRSARLTLDPARSLGVRTADADRAWVLHIGPEGTALDRTEGDADCTVTGTASDLYLLLWNRSDRDVIDVDGDAGMLDYWRKEARVRWG